MNNALDILLNHLCIEKKICSFYDKYELRSALTYKEILVHSQNYAKNIQKMVGNKKTPILISLETSEEFLFSFFGTMISGNIPVPIASKNLLLPKDFADLVEKIKASCNSNFMIAKTNSVASSLKYLTPNELKKENTSILDTPVINKDDIAFIQYSSGSTEAPKGVAVTHKNLLFNLNQIKKSMEVTDQDRICSWLPLYHDMGLVGVLLASLYSNVNSYLMSPLDFILSQKQWFKLLTDKKITIIVAPNAAYNSTTKRIKKEDLAQLDLSSIRLALSGAEPVNLDVCQKFVTHFGQAKLQENVIFPVYGLAEATLAVSFNSVGSPIKYLSLDYDQLILNNKAVDSKDDIGSFKTVSCGRELKGSSIEIRQSNMLAQENSIGEIHIKGENVAKNYYGREEHLKEGWFATGDLGFKRDNNLYIVGRIKDLVIINGRNIAANDIEARACRSGVLKLGKTVAFSYLNKEGHEKIKLIAETCMTNKKERFNLKNQISQEIQALVPITAKDIHFLPPLYIKKTTSGKVKRFHIKEKYLEGRVEFWEKWFRLLFIGSQSRIFLATARFVLQNIYAKKFKRT